MSGVVTPLIDTLLHQVLGKRGDVPVAREMLEPVKPMTPGSALQAVKSDSRLESGRAGGTLSQPVSKETQQTSGRALPPLSTPSSTATHFSPAARTIADILVKFPAPPSVISPSMPLLPKHDARDVPLLAARLQNSIDTSGLFYESHLARWFRGELSRAVLMREPQMQWQNVLSQRGARASHAEGRASSQPRLTPASGVERAGQSPLLQPQPGALTPDVTTSRSATSETMRLTAQASMARDAVDNIDPGDTADDAVQRVVRHQLELMVTPTLRWEGDVWSGLFMALTLQLPAGLEEREASGREQQEDQDASFSWHSSLNLRLANLGELDVQVHFRERSLSLAIRSDHEPSLASLKASQSAFEARLRQSGLEDVRISVLPSHDESSDVEGRS